METPSGAQIEELFSSECSRVSPACKGEGEANGDDLYQGASADGTKLYFTTNRQLANSDLDGSNQNATPKRRWWAAISTSMTPPGRWGSA